MERFLLFLIATTSCTMSVALDTSHGFEVNLPTQKSRECTRYGFMCEDCSVSNICHQMANGTWVKEFAEDCTATGQTCKESTGICTSYINGPCETIPEVEGFKCNDVGTYPEPYNCSTYHVCVRDKDGALLRYTDTCPPGVWFDTLTLRCSLNATVNCVPPVPKCTRVTQGAVRNNPRMYYLCVPSTMSNGQRSYNPDIFYCPGTLKYLRGNCFNPSTDLGIVNGKCTMDGNLYVPTCDRFNWCNYAGAPPTLKTCGSSAFFNTTSEKCQPYDCQSLIPQ